MLNLSLEKSFDCLSDSNLLSSGLESYALASAPRALEKLLTSATNRAAERANRLQWVVKKTKMPTKIHYCVCFCEKQNSVLCSCLNLLRACQQRVGICKKKLEQVIAVNQQSADYFLSACH